MAELLLAFSTLTIGFVAGFFFGYDAGQYTAHRDRSLSDCPCCKKEK